MTFKPEIKEKLKGYQLVKNFKDLNPGDQVRYFINNEFRSGGTIKLIKFPKYVVLMNVVKNVTWCVQFTNPTLKMYVKSLAKINKERKEKELIYKMYKNGELIKSKNST